MSRYGNDDNNDSSNEDNEEHINSNNYNDIIKIRDVMLC